MIWRYEDGSTKLIYDLTAKEFDDIITDLDSYYRGMKRLMVLYNLLYLDYNIFWGDDLTSHKKWLIALVLLVKKAEILFGKTYEIWQYDIALNDLDKLGGYVFTSGGIQLYYKEKGKFGFTHYNQPKLLQGI